MAGASQHGDTAHGRGNGMRLSRLVGVIAEVVAWIAMAAAALMALHVSAEIVSRLVLGRGLTGTIETVSYYYMVAVTFLPLGRVQAHHDHIVADSLAMVVPRILRPITDLLGKLISVGVMALLLAGAISSALSKTEMGEYIVASTFDLPIWPARWFAVIGIGAMLLVMLAQLLGGRPGQVTPPDPADHALPVD